MGGSAPAIGTTAFHMTLGGIDTIKSTAGTLTYSPVPRQPEYRYGGE